MYKRFALAGVIITLLAAATVASAVLLEVNEAFQIFHRNTTSSRASHRRSWSSATTAARPRRCRSTRRRRARTR
jgi:hypothetical protein